ncbi:hypothetical protein Fmac_018660 [Flemingia macrophylla]|uniref:Uncharacterized protein n=1 Tax=Flemingia macrophylla TaxID=520843 RepID=A0ABD1M5M4_9FABA
MGEVRGQRRWPSQRRDFSDQKAHIEKEFSLSKSVKSFLQDFKEHFVKTHELHEFGRLSFSSPLGRVCCSALRSHCGAGRWEDIKRAITLSCHHTLPCQSHHVLTPSVIPIFVTPCRGFNHVFSFASNRFHFPFHNLDSFRQTGSITWVSVEAFNVSFNAFTKSIPLIGSRTYHFHKQENEESIYEESKNHFSALHATREKNTHEILKLRKRKLKIATKTLRRLLDNCRRFEIAVVSAAVALNRCKAFDLWLVEFAFEICALEDLLEAICSFLDSRTIELETLAYLALDELTFKAEVFETSVKLHRFLL